MLHEITNVSKGTILNPLRATAVYSIVRTSRYGSPTSRKEQKMVSPAFIPAVAHPLAAPARGAVTARRALVMSMRKHAARLAAIPATLATVAPALASEGTGEGLGIDSALLYIPLIGIPIVLLVFFLQFDGSQNKEDFLGEYDQRRN